ncbi:hypothetical protein HO133_002106 [Letharia lupina]|uniref:RFX-type winged-helix domain-containing protein n=1 Tax=Letharia lupina TaxID=560253 RepID=A0A8H6CDG4_9LECA|nr:uncharacterized protein HO133_002106 [Letharia lupina]KAF6221251.1 hypothetical protein HO133_002106 [Letharia lupina]
MAVARRPRWRPLLSTVIVAAIAGSVVAKNVAQLSVPEIEDAIQACPIIQELNIHKRATNPETSSWTSQIFEQLFPGSPAVNALLATLYISGPPNFLLALCPPNIDPSSLSVMVAFAVGGLLGDTLFHLLPEIFLGEAAPDHARFVMVEPNKNLLLGVAIMVGFLTFVAMDKSLRIATGGEGGHDHSHSHKGEVKEEKKQAPSTAVATGAKLAAANGSVKSRKKKSVSESITSDRSVLQLPAESLRKLWTRDEPQRANRWLEEVLEEDPDSGVMQIALWKAYQAAFRDSRAPLVEATTLIHSASRVFEGASAQVIKGHKPKFIIEGVRPRQPAREKSEAKAPQALIKPSSKAEPSKVSKKEPSASIKLSAYLNLIADFTHNITDGLALSSSFYASPTLGATTTVAVFFHEIPHEVGDFALLIQSGFSKKMAMGAQFVTALGAFLGTCLGIAVQELGKSGKGAMSGEVRSKGLAGTGLGWGDMLLPFTAGTFLYVGTVAVIPELLETGPNKREEVKKTVSQFVAMAVGAGIMLAISWS